MLENAGERDKGKKKKKKGRWKGRVKKGRTAVPNDENRRNNQSLIKIIVGHDGDECLGAGTGRGRTRETDCGETRESQLQ